jgi:hypothetical protein
VPRLEAEVVWTKNDTKLWAGALAQTNKSATDESASSYGISGGARLGFKRISLTASGYAGKGLGTTLMFLNGATGGSGGSDDLRDSYGGLGQLTFTPTDSKVTLAGSWGISILKAADTDPVDFETKNWLASGGIYFQATKSLKVVGEFNYAVTSDNADATEDNTSIAPAFGLMLFF